MLLRFALPAALAGVLFSAAVGAVSMVRIACDADNAGAAISVNGRFRGDCPLDVQVEPGTIRIDAVKRVDDSRERLFSEAFRIGDGAARRVEVMLSAPRLNAEAQKQRDERLAADREAAAERETRRQRELAGQQRLWQQQLEQLQAAAAAGDVAAMWRLGRWHENGYRVVQDRNAALAWYRKAAEAGHAGGMGGVAAFLYNGWGAPRDLAQARALAETAAERGDARAMNLMSVLHAQGAAGLPKDSTLAIQWAQRAADAGERRALYVLARGSFDRGSLSPQEAATVLQQVRRALEPGEEGEPPNADAMDLMGALYALGIPGLPQDSRAALEWYRRSAQSGSPRGMFNLAVAYRQGRLGLVRDDVTALGWFRKAADLGQSDAMYNLGWFYQHGQGGVALDKSLAIDWYRKAAAAGHAQAAANLKALN